jgi:hypothetical protein
LGRSDPLLATFILSTLQAYLNTTFIYSPSVP